MKRAHHTCGNAVYFEGKPALVYHAGWLTAARASVLPPRLAVGVPPIFDGPTV